MLDLDQLVDETMARMWDLHQEIYRILERNVERARLEIGHLPYDPWFFSHYVRFYSCMDIDAITRFKVQRAPHPMSGIELLFLATRIKVWKANEGELPISGQSIPRQAFLNQDLFPSTEWNKLEERPAIRPAKIAILWDVDSELHLGLVDLVCPKDIENPWKNGNYYFKRTIPHPAAAITVGKDRTEDATDIEVELDRKKVDSDDPED